MQSKEIMFLIIFFRWDFIFCVMIVNKIKHRNCVIKLSFMQNEKKRKYTPGIKNRIIRTVFPTLYRLTHAKTSVLDTSIYF